MSQDDQRNQPNEEPARDETAAAESTESVRVTAVGSGDTAGIAAKAPTTSRRREFRERGEGASRYAVVPEMIPTSGSEESWSAAPHPGYQPDPAIPTTNRRLMTAGLVGLVVLAAGSFAGYSILTAKSSNGNGPAPWTGTVQQNGAVVGGINAQNNGAAAPVDLPSGVTYGNSDVGNSGVFTAAVTSCRTASAITLPVTTQTGAPDAVRTWSAQAAAIVQQLRTDVAALQNAVNLGHPGAVASAANTLCLSYPRIAALPPMPDAAGSQAWSSAVSSFATGATQSLQSVSSDPNAKNAALDSLNQGVKQLDAMSARINSVA